MMGPCINETKDDDQIQDSRFADMGVTSDLAAVVKAEDGYVDPRKTVTFDVVEVREYDRCLGDNPVARKGPPLSIDWRYEEIGSIEVEKYEVSKAKRRFQVELLVPGNIRSRMLQEQANVSVEDIKATMHRMEEVKQQRRISVVMQEFEQWVIFYQSLKRKMKRLFDCNMRGKKISALE